MSGDLRGFVYALQPLLQLRQWRVDAVKARLGRLQSEIDSALAELRALAEEQRVANEEAARSFLKAGDSQAHGRRLEWLVLLRERRTSMESQLSMLRERRTAVRGEYRIEQQTLDAIEAHRGDAVLGHSREEVARSANEADRDWLIRVAIRNATAPGGPA